MQVKHYSTKYKIEEEIIKLTIEKNPKKITIFPNRHASKACSKQLSLIAHNSFKQILKYTRFFLKTSWVTLYNNYTLLKLDKKNNTYLL